MGNICAYLKVAAFLVSDVTSAGCCASLRIIITYAIKFQGGYI